MAGYIGSKAVSVNTTSATISDDLSVGDDATITGDLAVDGVANLDNTDIDGTLDVSGQVTVADGSAGAPSISNTGDVNTGILFPAADTIAFTTGGTERLRIDDDGSLLLGQTAANNDFGDGRVFLSMKGTGSTDYSGVQMANNGTSGNDQILGLLAFYDGTTSENARIGALRESANTDAGLRFYTRPTGGSLTERVRIDHDGNFGLGISAPTTAYGRGLQIHDTGTAGANLRLTDSNTGSGTGNGFEIIVLNADNYIVNREAGPIFTLINGNSVQKIDANGAVTKPLQPAFLAIPNAIQSNVATSGSNIVKFNTQVFDQGGNFQPSIGNGDDGDINNLAAKFAAPVTGKYQLSFSVYLNQIDTATDYYEASLITSNRNYHVIIDPGGFSADLAYWSLNLSILADMDASDTAIVRFIASGGTAQTDIATSSTFSGYLVA